MTVQYKKLSLWSYDLIIHAKAQAPHIIFDDLKDEACFYYVLEGNSKLYMPLSEFEVNNNEGVSMRCGKYIGKFLSNSTTNDVEIIIVKFPREIIKKIYSKELPNLFNTINKVKTNTTQKIKSNLALKQYVMGLIFYIENPHLAIEELLVLKIRELIILLANTDNLDVINDLINGLFDEMDFSFKQSVEKNISSNLKLEELAHLNAMSLSTFKRKFIRIYGVSPHKYFLSKKMERSKNLIINSSMSFAVISEQSGYKDYSNFSIAFKKYFNQSPRSLRPSKRIKTKH